MSEQPEGEAFLKELFLKTDTQLKEAAEFLPPEKVALVIQHLTDTQQKEPLKLFFSGVNSEEQLIAIGKLLSSVKAIALLTEVLKETPSEQWKISSLFIGMSRQMFLAFLTSASPDHLRVLQHAALLEPLQHHLTTFAHEADEALKERDGELIAIQGVIDTLQVETLTFDELKKLTERIAKLTRDIEGLLILVSRALSVAWSTPRPDLIDRLSKAKEALLRFNSEFIGSPGVEPSGIWLLLRKKGDLVFGDPKANDPEALYDDEPAIEALGKLGLNGLHDFQHVGLLEEKKLDAPKGEEREWQEKKLEELAQELKELHLSTVGDFKRAHLFSKELLASYIRYKKAKSCIKT